VVSGAFVVLAAVAAAIGISRQQAVQARGAAEAEARRAEAAELLALGRLELEDYPTAGLAYALASLERSDSPAARRFAVETLAHGAAAFILPVPAQSASFSHDGRWLATGGLLSGVHLWSHEGGTPVSLLESWSGVPMVQFDPQSPPLSVQDDTTTRVFSPPGTEPVQQLDVQRGYVFPRGSRFFAYAGVALYTRALGEGEWRRLGHLPGVGGFHLSPSGARLAYSHDREVFVTTPEGLEGSRHRVGEHPAAVGWVEFASDDEHLVSSDESGEIRLWSLEGETARLQRSLHSGLRGRVYVAADRAQSTLVAAQFGSHGNPDVALAWDLSGPPDADPPALRNGAVTFLNSMALDRDGRWLAAASNELVSLWPLAGRSGRIIRGQTPHNLDVTFTPDGKWLAAVSRDEVCLYPLSPTVAAERQALVQESGAGFSYVAADPTDRSLVVVSIRSGRIMLIPLDGGPARRLPRVSSAWLESPAISHDGRRVAAGSRMRPAGNLIEVWDLGSGEVRGLDPRSATEECAPEPNSAGAVLDVGFTSDGRLLSAGMSGLRLWNLDDGTNALLRPCPAGRHLPFVSLGSSLEDRFLLVETDLTQKTSTLSFHDLRSGTSRELASHGNAVLSVALDPKGEIAVSGDYHGVVRVGKVDDPDPHLLFGHEFAVSSVAVSPNGQWIASASQDGTIRLWPMPDLTRPPLHTLPQDELLDRLRSYTNLRVVEDADSGTGYRVEAGPFPGWNHQPDW
jgi:WD40 repeat protein